MLAGVLVLNLFKIYNPEIMPDVFLERSLPSDIRWSHILISFLVPYSVSSLFTFYALSYFKRNHSSYIELLRKVGE